MTCSISKAPMLFLALCAPAFVQCTAKLTPSVLQGHRNSDPFSTIAFVATPNESVEAGSPVSFSLMSQNGSATAKTYKVSAFSDASCASVLKEEETQSVSLANQDTVTAAIKLKKAGHSYLAAVSDEGKVTCSPSIEIAPSIAEFLSIVSIDGRPLTSESVGTKVLVTDRFGNPVPGANVHVRLTSGTGVVTTANVVTMADGTASLSYEYGTAVGSVTFAVDLIVNNKIVTSSVISESIKNRFCDQTATHAVFQFGSGTAADPFILCTDTQLAGLATHTEFWDKYFRLEHDIDLSAYDTSTAAKSIGPIGHKGTDTNLDKAFNSVFDGNGYTISHYKNQRTAPQDWVGGLFGWAADATIKNLKLIDADTAMRTSGFSHGLLVGTCDDCSLNAITITGGISLTGVGSCSPSGPIAGIVNVTAVTKTVTMHDITVNANVDACDAGSIGIGRAV